jgi:hypothetical protein
VPSFPPPVSVSGCFFPTFLLPLSKVITQSAVEYEEEEEERCEIQIICV